MKGVSIKEKKKPNTQKTCIICALFFCSFAFFLTILYLEYLSKKTLGFEKKEKKTKGGYHDSISLQVGCGLLP